MATLKDRLDAFDGQPEQGWNKRKSISVGERGQVYRANFSHEYLSAVYAIDGGIPSLIFTKLLQKNWNGTLAKFKK